MPALIELHTNDLSAVKSYYVDMGFSVAWDRQPGATEGYLALQMDDNVLCFRGDNRAPEQPQYQQIAAATTGPLAQIVIMVQDVETYYAKVQSFANITEPLAMQESGQLDFHCTDPNGNHVRFTNRYDPLDPSTAN